MVSRDIEDLAFAGQLSYGVPEFVLHCIGIHECIENIAREEQNPCLSLEDHLHDVVENTQRILLLGLRNMKISAVNDISHRPPLYCKTLLKNINSSVLQLVACHPNIGVLARPHCPKVPPNSRAPPMFPHNIIASVSSLQH
jgi:hypothetical protein